jgi:hypothetical protein
MRSTDGIFGAARWITSGRAALTELTAWAAQPE